ncbi:hypothetical protein [Lonomia obliqua multiple nucleopolyhedrovirus]|uniref:Uncharacterized protein n=1 Tax=Lonomia obliqua multiple nucleopolyhedrovirus TaxID=134394 RepID=A0A126FC43_9ABAC|nr:hypothetical protein [Lonomia obliqua multiple nucleopolyhedrovirus]AKN80962.1 hypothetical protein [Lonomia obliqua multiple nucleopolyhedrovirus]
MSYNKKFTLLFVWYHMYRFIFNTDMFPFWHNVQYHAKRFNCVILYCIERNEDALKLPKLKNVTFINFKTNFPAHYAHSVQNITKQAGKIDYMKLCAMLNPVLLNVKYSHLQLMDMDCVVQNVSWSKLFNRSYCYEPFYDSTMKTLSRLDSYLENYATLIRTKFVYKNSKILNAYKSDLLTICVDNNYVLYKFYIDMIIDVYLQCYGYKMPESIENVTLSTSIKMSFRRGNSWQLDIEALPAYDYIYNSNTKPIFKQFNLCQELYLLILNYEGDATHIYQIIEKLKRLNYNFSSKFDWSNQLQCYVNIYGVICDRIKNFNVSNYEYILPLKTYNK